MIQIELLLLSLSTVMVPLGLSSPDWSVALRVVSAVGLYVFGKFVPPAGVIKDLVGHVEAEMKRFLVVRRVLCRYREHTLRRLFYLLSDTIDRNILIGDPLGERDGGLFSILFNEETPVDLRMVVAKVCMSRWVTAPL